MAPKFPWTTKMFRGSPLDNVVVHGFQFHSLFHFVKQSKARIWFSYLTFIFLLISWMSINFFSWLETVWKEFSNVPNIFKFHWETYKFPHMIVSASCHISYISVIHEHKSGFCDSPSRLQKSIRAVWQTWRSIRVDRAVKHATPMYHDTFYTFRHRHVSRYFPKCFQLTTKMNIHFLTLYST